MSEIKKYDELFRQTFLDYAPLYVNSTKFKLKIPEIRFSSYPTYIEEKANAPIRECNLLVEEVAAYRNLVSTPTETAKNAEIKKAVEELAMHAGILINGWLAKERNNFKGIIVCPDQRRHVSVDIFEESNFQLSIVWSAGPSLSDPLSLIPGWVSYKFHFACSYL